MTGKPIRLRQSAQEDVRKAAHYYTVEAGLGVAETFLASLADAYDIISENPQMGSPRYAVAINLPNLRHRKLRRFPFLVFYLERDDRIDVVRVLHAARDIPAWLSNPESDD